MFDAFGQGILKILALGVECIELFTSETGLQFNDIAQAKQEEESKEMEDRLANLVSNDRESMDRAADPGTVLDISVRKQREASEDLYKRVLVNNTAKAAQREISRNILQSLFC